MRLVYFISTFIPPFVALVILWRRALWKKNDPLLKKALPVLIILGLVGLINGIAENPALHWGIWTYNPTTTLGVTIYDVLLETYIYCVLVPIAIGSAAIKFAERQDRKYGKS
jgi:lycopene cyclase domain-containing protein